MTTWNCQFWIYKENCHCSPTCTARLQCPAASWLSPSWIARLQKSFKILNLSGFIQIARLRSQKSFRKPCWTWQDSSSGPGCEIQWGPRKDCTVGDPVRKSKRLSDGRSRFTKSILLRWKLLLSGDQTCSSSSVEVGMPHCFAARKLLCSIDAWRKNWNKSWAKVPLLGGPETAVKHWCLKTVSSASPGKTGWQISGH